MKRMEWKWNVFSSSGGRLFLLFLLLFLLIMGAAFSMVLSKWMEWNGMQEYVDVAEKRLANLQKMEGINRPDEEELHQLLQRLPGNPKRSDFLRALRQAVEQSGVAFLSLSENETGNTQNVKDNRDNQGKAKEGNGEEYRPVPYSLAVSGSYSNISSFLSLLYKMPRVIHITDLSIQAEHRATEPATAGNGTGVTQQGFDSNARYVLHVELATFYLPEEQ